MCCMASWSMFSLLRRRTLMGPLLLRQRICSSCSSFCTSTFSASLVASDVSSSWAAIGPCHFNLTRLSRVYGPPPNITHLPHCNLITCTASGACL
jgi:hypothetical protein